MTIPRRRLGRTGLEVSALGYGAWGIGGAQWIGAQDDVSIVALEEAIAAGVNFIDTALAYGDGHSEQLVGRVVRATPDPVHVATKVPPADGRWPAKRGYAIEPSFSGAWITEATERSLRNLGLDTIDVQQLHTWTDDWVHEGDWAEAVSALKEAGKIRFFGVSIRNHDPGSVLELVQSGLIDTVQVIYNIFDQSPELELFDAALRDDIGIIVRVPLDEGGLTGRLAPDTTFPDGDFRNHYFAGERLRETAERAQAIIADLAIGEDDLAAVALRFCLSHPATSTVIAGMRSVENVRRNVATVEQGPLDEAQLATLRRHAWERPAD